MHSEKISCRFGSHLSGRLRKACDREFAGIEVTTSNYLRVYIAVGLLDGQTTLFHFIGVSYSLFK